MIKPKHLMTLILILTLLSGCSGETETKPVVNTETQTETSIEAIQEKNEPSEVADDQEETTVTQVTEQEPFERVVEVDEELLNLGDYTYLTLYLNQSREAVIHDFGEPTQSKGTDNILIYDDYGFIMDGDNVTNVGVTNGELVGAKTGMTEDELVSVLGEPHDVTDLEDGDIYWYIDNDRAITASIENNVVRMLGYCNYLNANTQEDTTTVDIGEYIYMTDKGLVLRTMYVEDRFITGIIENISGDVRKMIDLEFAFYDAEGNKISHDWDYLTELQPYETWKYKVRLDDNGTQFKFISLESE